MMLSLGLGSAGEKACSNSALVHATQPSVGFHDYVGPHDLFPLNLVLRTTIVHGGQL